MQAQDFLVGVLGTDGYQALSKAAERLSELEHVFIPRTILAWLDCAARSGFEGQVPGTEAVITKGELVIGRQSYPLGDESLTTERVRASAALAIAVDFEGSIPKDLDGEQVARLSKAVDTLTKARFIKMVKDLEASAAKEITPGEATGSEGSESHDDVDISEALKQEELVKEAAWRSANDKVAIPKEPQARQAWDDQYHQAMADRFAGGDRSKLVPVQVPVSEHAGSHYVPSPGSSAAKNLPRYRVPMYQKMLQAGHELPPVFAQQVGPKGVFRIIDGNARLAAALAQGNITHLPGFMLKKGIEEPGKAAAPRPPAGPSDAVAPRKAALTGAGKATQAQPVAQPKGPGIPQPPAGAQPAQKSMAAPAVSRTRGFYKSELVKACQRCGETQMRGRRVVGCLCITDVIMGTEIVQKTEGDRVELQGPDQVIALIEGHVGLTVGT